MAEDDEVRLEPAEDGLLLNAVRATFPLPLRDNGLYSESESPSAPTANEADERYFRLLEELDGEVIVLDWKDIPEEPPPEVETDARVAAATSAELNESMVSAVAGTGVLALDFGPVLA